MAKEKEILDKLFSNSSLPERSKGFAASVMKEITESPEKSESIWSIKQWFIPALQLCFSIFVISTYQWQLDYTSTDELVNSLADNDLELVEDASESDFFASIGISEEINDWELDV